MFSFDRFESLRASKGITKKYIADALDRTPTLIQDWKGGKSAPNEAQLRVVADILGTTPEYLSGETDNKEPPAPKSGNGRSETPNEMEERFMNAVRLLLPEQQAFLLGMIEAAVRKNQEETRQTRPSRSVVQAAPVGR